MWTHGSEKNKRSVHEFKKITPIIKTPSHFINPEYLIIGARLKIIDAQKGGAQLNFQQLGEFGEVRIVRFAAALQV